MKLRHQKSRQKEKRKKEKKREREKEKKRKKHDKLRSVVHCDITLACDSHIERQQRHRHR